MSCGGGRGARAAAADRGARVGESRAMSVLPEELDRARAALARGRAQAYGEADVDPLDPSFARTVIGRSRRQRFVCATALSSACRMYR